MKSKILFISFFVMFICFSACSKKIKKLEISDSEFLFNIMNFTKQYKIETYLTSFDVGIYFKEPILKENIELGSLGVCINGQEQRVILKPDVRFFYSDYKNNLVNKIYFQNITLADKKYIQELEVSVIDIFSFPAETELLINNFDSEFFFDK